MNKKQLDDAAMTALIINTIYDGELSKFFNTKKVDNFELLISEIKEAQHSFSLKNYYKTFSKYIEYLGYVVCYLRYCEVLNISNSLRIAIVKYIKNEFLDNEKVKLIELKPWKKNDLYHYGLIKYLNSNNNPYYQSISINSKSKEIYTGMIYPNLESAQKDIKKYCE